MLEFHKLQWQRADSILLFINQSNSPMLGRRRNLNASVTKENAVPPSFPTFSPASPRLSLASHSRFPRSREFAISSPAELRRDWPKRDCSQSSCDPWSCEGIRSFRSKCKKLFRSEPEICSIHSFFYPTKARNISLFLERKGRGTKWPETVASTTRSSEEATYFLRLVSNLVHATKIVQNVFRL